MASAEVDKHLLERKWFLYYDIAQKHKAGQYNGPSYRPIYSFDNAEDFWRLQHTVKKPSELPPGSTYFLFKEGVKPEWEDKLNAEGGCWTVAVSDKQHLDKVWLNIVLALIGEQCTEADEINGISLNIRGKDRIEIWTRTATNKEKQISIMTELKKLSEILGNCAYSSFFANANSKAKDVYAV